MHPLLLQVLARVNICVHVIDFLILCFVHPSLFQMHACVVSCMLYV